MSVSVMFEPAFGRSLVTADATNSNVVEIAIFRDLPVLLSTVLPRTPYIVPFPAAPTSVAILLSCGRR
jgi:hypothetical protein